jgi:hypothetical protein
MSTNASCKPPRKPDSPAARTCRWQPAAQCPDLAGQPSQDGHDHTQIRGELASQGVLGGGEDESGGVAGPGSVGAGGGGSCGVEYGSVASLGPEVVGPEGPGGAGGGVGAAVESAAAVG